MEMFKNLISSLFENTIKKYSTSLSKKEFISKQLRLYDIRLKLLAFLGRKEGNFTIVDLTEGIELTLKRPHSSKHYYCEISNNLENIKWNERPTS